MLDNDKQIEDKINGQEEEHSFEERIYRPLFDKQTYKPFFHYCKICPKIEFLSLKSIEYHIKFNDSECHKAKLLEIIQGENMGKLNDGSV